MKISPRKGRRPAAKAESTPREPLVTWWMPLAGIVLALGWAGWEGASSDAALRAFISALAWPGLAIFAATTFLVWLAWKVDLE